MRLDSELSVKASNLKYPTSEALPKAVDMESILRAQVDSAVKHNADLMQRLEIA